MTLEEGDLAALAALAQALDQYLGGVHGHRQVELIEEALDSADWWRERLDGFDDLELATACYCPGCGPEYYDDQLLTPVAGYVRRALHENFGL